MRKLCKLCSIGAYVVMGISAFTLPAAATTLGLDFLTAPSSQQLQNASAAGETAAGDILGFEFTLGSAITVYALGTFDGGVASNIPVAATVDLVQTGTSTILASASVGGSSGGTQITSWLFNPVTPVTLSAGVTYTVYAALAPTDVVTDPLGEVSSSVFTINPAIATSPPITGVYSTSLYEADTAFLGANFDTSALATPLPAALPLFATGLGAMGLLGWRRKRKNNAAIAAA